MTLEDVVDAFVTGWSATRRLSGPFEVDHRDGARWLHDPTGRRRGELVAVDLSPSDCIERYPSGHPGAICAIYPAGADLGEKKAEFKALGWRLMRTEPAFFHGLRDLPPLDSRVRRLRTAEEVAEVCRHARMRPATMGAADEDDAPIRLYEATFNGQHAGWVRSIRAGANAWVGSLNVREPFRRRGLGSGLMAALLANEARLGRRANVLLASHTGALLYPRLGYERVGTLMLLMPKKG